MHVKVALIAAVLLAGIGYMPGHFAAEGSVGVIPRAHFLDFIDYTFTLNSSQIFPNETMKNEVLENETSAQYYIPNLEHDLMGHTLNATDVKVNVTPTTIDDNRTRLDLSIHAEKVNVTGSNNGFYEKVDLDSLYGIYDRNTDMIEMHVPLDVALSYIGSLS